MSENDPTSEQLDEQMNKELLKSTLEDAGLLEDLNPYKIPAAIKQFLKHKSTDIEAGTVDEYRRRLQVFKKFCGKQGVEQSTDLDPQKIEEYRHWRRTESTQKVDTLGRKTMRDEMYLLRDLLEYLESIDAVEAHLSKAVHIPQLDPDDGVRNDELSSDRLTDILRYLEQYEYGSRAHVIWECFAETGCRPGSLYAIDLEDLQLDCDDPYIDLRHRNETPLKKNERSEREIGLDQRVADVLRDYVENKRIDVTTSSGRRPFLTSRHGRLAKSTIRRHVYRYSRPCKIGKECPHDRDPSSCDAAQDIDAASNCDSSTSPMDDVFARHSHVISRRNRSTATGTSSRYSSKRRGPPSPTAVI